VQIKSTLSSPLNHRITNATTDSFLILRRCLHRDCFSIIFPLMQLPEILVIILFIR